MATNKTETAGDENVIQLPGAGGEVFGADEIGQIRHLLLGQHAAAMSERIDRVERELLSALDGLSTRVGERLDALDHRIGEEAIARAGAQIDLRNDLERQSADIRHQIGSVQMDLKRQLANAEAELRERHVDRSNLAGLLEQVAAELNSDQ